VWAYKRSALQYSTIRESLGDPDPFRLKYRKEIKAYITEAVKQLLSPKQLEQKINADPTIPTEIKTELLTTIRHDLNTLHNGNILRYGLRPSELTTWKQRS